MKRKQPSTAFSSISSKSICGYAIIVFHKETNTQTSLRIWKSDKILEVERAKELDESFCQQILVSAACSTP